MLPIEYKARIRRYIEEVWNKRNLAVIEELASPEFTLHHPAYHLPLKGLSAERQYVMEVQSAFPDFHATLDDIVADGQMVAIRWKAGGTQQGTFRGIEATGKYAHWEGMTFIRFKDGKMFEAWWMPDRLGQLQQLGAAPNPALTAV